MVAGCASVRFAEGADEEPALEVMVGNLSNGELGVQ